MVDIRTRMRARKAFRVLSSGAGRKRSWGLTGDGTGKVEGGSIGYLYVRPEGAGPPVRALNLAGIPARQNISVELGEESGRYVILGVQPEGAPFYSAPPTSSTVRGHGSEHLATGADPSGGLSFVLADRDSDGDYDPLTAAAWENSTKSGNGPINWNAVFGVPSRARGVMLLAIGTDGVASTLFRMKAKASTTNYSFEASMQVAAVTVRAHGVVPVAADGTSYYNFSAAWDSFYLRVVGWFI